MSQSPITTSPANSNETPISSSPVIEATPITTIHPSFDSALNSKPKKTTTKRAVTSETSKSKKSKASSLSVSKKGSKAKGSRSKSKSIHTMQELYVDDVAKKNAEPHVEASNEDRSEENVVAEGNPNNVTETLEIQKGLTIEKPVASEAVGEIVQDSPDALNDKDVEEVLNSLKDTIPTSNVVPDVETSLAQNEPTPDIVGNAVNIAEQVDEEPATDEIVVPQTEKEPVTDEEEDTDILSTDNAMSVDDDVVDVDAMEDLEQTVSEVASGSIARRLRNRKGKAADVVTEVVPKATPSKKKKMIGPSRKPSKVEIASEKKKNGGKRKQAEVGDSDYEVEEDVPHIASNIVSPSKKKSQKKFRRAAIPDLDVVDDVPNIVSTGKKKVGGKIIPQNVPDVPMDNISFHFIESSQK
ncbi:hypothetical protein P8452_17245 [Trifolium repens]|nr:hypothetical protein P8452_17245 [Trifolium repens]